jgi:hypothetical protein
MPNPPAVIQSRPGKGDLDGDSWWYGITGEGGVRDHRRYPGGDGDERAFAGNVWVRADCLSHDLRPRSVVVGTGELQAPQAGQRRVGCDEWARDDPVSVRHDRQQRYASSSPRFTGAGVERGMGDEHDEVRTPLATSSQLGVRDVAGPRTEVDAANSARPQQGRQRLGQPTRTVDDDVLARPRHDSAHWVGHVAVGKAENLRIVSRAIRLDRRQLQQVDPVDAVREQNAMIAEDREQLVGATAVDSEPGGQGVQVRVVK